MISRPNIFFILCLSRYFPLTQASSDGRKQRLPETRAHRRQDYRESLTSVDTEHMLLPHERVVSDFSWLQAPHEKDSAFKEVNDLDDEELFLYGSDDAAQQTHKTSHSNYSQNGGQSKCVTSSYPPKTHRQDKPVLASLGNLLLKHPPQVSSPSLASSYLDSSQCEQLRNILKSVHSSSETEKKPQRPREEKRSHPASRDSDSESVSKPAVKEKNVLQALESFQSLIKGKVPFIDLFTDLFYST